jgi:DNA-binding phage protein
VAKIDPSKLAKSLADAERRVRDLRAQLDARLCDRHAAGDSIAQLARETALSRETVYRSIKRHHSGT